jgi:hypothetical protein
METRRVAQAPVAVEPDDVRQVLDRVLKSKHFVNAHKKKRFLQLVCDFYLKGKAHELNEHLLAYDVFERDSNYNPSADPIVRVFAHDIRKKLETYYQTEGAADTIRLEIPPGSYQPVFTRRPDKADSQDSAVVGSQARSRFASPATIGLLVAVLCLAIVTVVLVVSNRQLREQVKLIEVNRDPAATGEVWAAFLKDSNPPLVILSNPPVLRLTNPSDPDSLLKDSISLEPSSIELLKDKFVTNPGLIITESDTLSGDRAGNADSKKDRVTPERSRPPGLIFSTNDYTGMGEAIGLHYLTDFFHRTGRSIVLKQSRTLSVEDLKKHNVILLGGVWVNEWSSKLARTDDFVFTGRATIENRNPRPGEEREYLPQFDRRTGNLIIDYGLITIKPNISEANQVILLAGIHSQGTEAAAEYLTERNYLDQLNQRLVQTEPGSPHYFQVLLRVGVENGIPTTITMLAFHELTIPNLEAVTINR